MNFIRELKYLLRRRLWWVLRCCLPVEITDHVDGATMRYRLRTDIGTRLYLEGAFERKEIALIAKILRARPSRELVIFDLGANVGVHSMALCSLLPHARVVAFEPAADTRRILELNVRSNGLTDRILVEPHALSNALGTAEFFETEDDAYNSLKDTRRKKLLRKSMVQLETLDHYVGSRAVQRVDLVKIDVEGFESEVIEGGLAMLTAMKPDLFVEIYQGRNSNADPARTIGLLTGVGYKGWVVEDGALQSLTQHRDSLYNYFFSVRDVASDLAR